MPRKPMPPLLAALVATWPEPGKPFPAAEREASIAMQRNAWDVVYGPVERAQVGFGTINTVVRAPPLNPSPSIVPAQSPGPWRCYVDHDGFAMASDGQPIAHAEVPAGSVIVDKRAGLEAGDPAAIIWKGAGAAFKTLPPGTALKLAASDEPAAA